MADRLVVYADAEGGEIGHALQAGRGNLPGHLEGLGEFRPYLALSLILYPNPLGNGLGSARDDQKRSQGQDAWEFHVPALWALAFELQRERGVTRCTKTSHLLLLGKGILEILEQGPNQQT